MKINWKMCIANMVLSVGIGITIILLAFNGMELEHNLVQPVLSPPVWLFSALWSVFYVLMGISACFISSSTASQDCRQALYIYGIQLFLSVCWLMVLFLLKSYLGAFFLLAVLWVCVLLMILRFAEIHRPASKLQIPYLVWLTFAGYFNIMVYLLN